MQAETTGQRAHTRTIIVQGQQLRVAIRPGNGTSTPLLLMNGVGADLEVLQPFVNALDPTLEVIRFDVPGTGGSPAPPLPYHLSMLAGLVTKMLDQLGYQQVDVLGVSWGGGLAQQFAFHYPHRCRRLILVSTSTGMTMIPGDLSLLNKMATPRRYRDPDYMAEIAGDLYGGLVRSSPKYAREFAHGVRQGGMRGYLYQMLASAGWTSLPWISRIRQPTLIMSGDDDPIVPPINAQILHRLIPHSKLYIFNDGHLGLATKARELSQVVWQFLTAS